jgi:hypothetical protein
MEAEKGVSPPYAGTTKGSCPFFPKRHARHQGSARLPRRRTAMTQDINVLALVKGAERYVFLYDDANRAEALRVLGRFASNPDLSFTWYDAAVLSQKIRQECQKQTVSRRFSLPMSKDDQ